MNQNWKDFEGRMAESFSELFFGIEKPKGGRRDRDIPLIRANDSGAHHSDIFPGDIVPNGRWWANGIMDFTNYRVCIEVKDVGSVNPILMLKREHTEIFTFWQQAVDQANELGKDSVPLLVMNQKRTPYKFVLTDWERMEAYAPNVNPPLRSFEFMDEGKFHTTLCFLRELFKSNPTPPFGDLVRRPPHE